MRAKEFVKAVVHDGRRHVVELQNSGQHQEGCHGDGHLHLHLFPQVIQLQTQSALLQQLVHQVLFLLQLLLPQLSFVGRNVRGNFTHYQIVKIALNCYISVNKY